MLFILFHGWFDAELAIRRSETPKLQTISQQLFTKETSDTVPLPYRIVQFNYLLIDSFCSCCNTIIVVRTPKPNSLITLLARTCFLFYPFALRSVVPKCNCCSFHGQWIPFLYNNTFQCFCSGLRMISSSITVS